jgi:hypothetical protein
MTASPHHLSEIWKAVLLCAFGLATSLVIVALAELGARPLDLLLLAASVGALVTAALWLWILATRRSLGWGVAFGLALLVPYLNFVVATIYARRYWSEGGRAPALLALLAIAVETIVSFRVFLPNVIPPV